MRDTILREGGCYSSSREGAVLQGREPFVDKGGKTLFIHRSSMRDGGHHPLRGRMSFVIEGGSHSSKEDTICQQGREDAVLQEREGAVRQQGMGDAILEGREDAVHQWGMGDAILHLMEDTVCQGREDKLDNVVGRKNNEFPNVEIHCSNSRCHLHHVFLTVAMGHLDQLP